MRRWFVGLSAVGALAWVGVVQHPIPGSTGTAPFIQCGSGAPGRPGIVVVHLLDVRPVRHWSIGLEAEPLTNSSLEMAGPGTIRIEIEGVPGPHSCEATAPSPFHVRALSTRLAGGTLRVKARRPVPVEVQDRSGKVLAKQVADPAQTARRSLGW